MSFIIRFGQRSNAQYYVGELDGFVVQAERKYFAARWEVAKSARAFVRDNLRRWGKSLDEIYVVRLRPSTKQTDETRPGPKQNPFVPFASIKEAEQHYSKGTDAAATAPAGAECPACHRADGEHKLQCPERPDPQPVLPAVRMEPHGAVPEGEGDG